MRMMEISKVDFPAIKIIDNSGLIKSKNGQLATLRIRQELKL